jgi:hypothetical protein
MFYLGDEPAMCGVATAPVVPVTAMNAAAVTTSLTDNQFNGQVGTPTRRVIEGAVAYLTGLADQNPKFMLLATDGQPNCATATGLNMDDSAGTQQAVTDALAAGIPTFVVGIGNTNAAATLNQVAIAGGRPQTGGTSSYYQVNDAAALAAALGTIVGQAASCTFDIGAPPDGTTATVVVTVTGLSGLVRGTTATVGIRHGGYWGLPDSWRFDPAGCQAEKMAATSGGSGDCPRLAEPTASIGQFYTTEVGGTAMFGAAFVPVTADPGVTYTIATFTFDLSNTTCACPDQPQCLHLSVTWLDENGDEHFAFLDREFVTWNDPLATTCGGFPLCGNPDDCVDPPNPCAHGPTPASRGSWGGLKASYR